MAPFEDRKDAARKLAAALGKYKDKNVVVLAIPRGGVEVGLGVAQHLNAVLGMIVCRKLPYRDNPESGFGAVAEDGSLVILNEALGFLSKEEVDKIIRNQKEEIKRRIAVLRQGKPLPELKDKTVVLVDDGIAMGSTMQAAVALCRNKKAKKVVVASPVAGPGVARAMEKIADDVVILEKPANFAAVAQVYNNWYDVPDEEVLKLMEGKH